MNEGNNLLLTLALIVAMTLALNAVIHGIIF
mgnify:FL=1|jgi:hypothetical protein